ncbi:hypothetical protein SUDANB1_05613 [Streptomyces sp. enrichment culture]|uniref:hypothetical protein n=1 Tax=Streptomyces sp. enrichment culture TaxID=1795815 RepID=UPI003F549560
MLYDLENGLRLDDRAARSFDYDPRPIVEGELGAGTFRCGTCGTAGACDCVVSCYSNQPTYEQYGCNVAGCVKHPNG